MITLGIIGVVAAMTMPTLMAQHRKKVVETRLAKFYSTMNQAIRMSEAENGSLKDWPQMLNIGSSGVVAGGLENKISAEEWYRLYLAKYIQTVKAEPSNTLEEKYDLYFADGSMVTFSGSGWSFYPDAKHYVLITDEETEITDRRREDCGKNYFTFVFNPDKGIEPYVKIVNGKPLYVTAEVLKTDSGVGCNLTATNERAYCTEVIRRNGWKIPKDYPLKF